MFIYISDGGDRSVGIHPNVITIEWNTGYPDDYTRKNDRAMFADMAKEFFDCVGRVEVFFGDECWGCLEVIGEDNECRRCKLERFADTL